MEHLRYSEMSANICHATRRHITEQSHHQFMFCVKAAVVAYTEQQADP
jgi:hypothetical protein